MADTANITVRNLDKSDESLIPRIAKLHIKAFPNFFLTQLGPRFLMTLYQGYLEDSDSGILIAEDCDHHLLGFLAYSFNYSRFYKGLMKTHLATFAFCSAGAAIKHPSFVKRLLGAFKKSDGVKRKEKYAELASIGVNPKAEGRGIGSKLIDELKRITDFNTYAYISLETDADNNEWANKFYQKNGFKLSREYTTGEGRRMNEYHYSGDKTGEKKNNSPIKNILILCHYAQQPPYNTMLRYHFWGRELVKRGYCVTMFAASTVHNTSIDVVDELGKNKDTVDGVNYIYARTPKYTGNGKARVKNMLSYCQQIKSLHGLNLHPDVIITCEAYLFHFARRTFKNVPIITDTVDLWPESIIEYANVSRSNPIIKILYQVEKDTYINSDALIFSMEGGKDYLSERSYKDKIDFRKVFHINMGCDLKEKDEELEKVSLTLPWNFNHNNIVYIGSIRQANNVQQICDAAKALLDAGHNDIDFQIYGNGDELEKLKKYSKEKEILNIHFYGRIQKDEIPYILAHSTANILNYKQVHLMKYGGSQSKLFDYLASGKPIICNAKFGYNLITRYDCGIVTENQSTKAFEKAVLKICNIDKDKLEKMGNNARKAAEDYDQPILVDKLENVFYYLIADT